MPQNIIPDSLYCDGGLIGPRNPSPLGGTWAFCHVAVGVRVLERSGMVEPDDLGQETVSNNDSELLAAIRALESVPEGWRGILYTDSAVTRFRLLNPEGTKRKGMKAEWVKRVREVKKTRVFDVVLIGGHPTRKELAKGFRSRNGLPVSEHNVWCDNACKRAGRKFLERNSLEK